MKKKLRYSFSIESGTKFSLDNGLKYIDIEINKLSKLDKRTLQTFCIELLKKIVL